MNKSSMYKLDNSSSVRCKNPPNTIFLLVFSMFWSWQIYGIFGAIPGLRGLFMLMTAVLSIFTAMVSTPDFFNKAFIKQRGVFILITLFVIFMIDFIIGNDFAYMQSFLPLMVYFCAYIHLRERKISKGFTLWILVNVVFKIIITFPFLKNDPLIVKHYDHIGYAAADGIERSVIGYSSIYLFTPCVILFLAYFFNKNNKYRKIAAITATLTIIMVYMSQVSAMIFSLTLLLLFLFIMKRSKAKNKKMLVVIILVIATLLWVFAVPILNYIADFDFLGETFQNRVEGLILVIEGGMEYVDQSYTGMLEGDSVVNRFYSYEKSFEALFHNFFLGKLTPNALQGEGHSQIIDMTSEYSIFAVFPWLLFCIFTLKNNLKDYKEYEIEITLIYGFMLIISILNNFGNSAVAMIGLIIIPQFLGESERKKSSEDIVDYKLGNRKG